MTNAEAFFVVGLLLFVGSIFGWEALRREGNRDRGRFALLTLVVPWGMAAAIVLIHAHSARFFDLAVLFSATLAGVGLVAALRQVNLSAVFGGPAIFFPSLMLGGAGNTFSEVPLASFVLVALAPCALWSLRLPLMRRWTERQLTVAAIVAILLPGLAAVALAMRAETLEFGE